ncbi:hypothetical protein HK104_003417 [Borealophlyctis nickersoniae]|nr:hypothetical protein HK104_003417 [Borealophlyctis nickersoniae]
MTAEGLRRIIDTNPVRMLDLHKHPECTIGCIDDAFLEELTKSCGKVEVLNLYGQTGLTEDAIARVLMDGKIRNVKSLCLNNVDVGEKAIDTIGTGCPLIERLSVVDCQKVEEALVGGVVERAARARRALWREKGTWPFSTWASDDGGESGKGVVEGGDCAVGRMAGGRSGSGADMGEPSGPCVEHIVLTAEVDGVNSDSPTEVLASSSSPSSTPAEPILAIDVASQSTSLAVSSPPSAPQSLPADPHTSESQFPLAFAHLKRLYSLVPENDRAQPPDESDDADDDGIVRKRDQWFMDEGLDILSLWEEAVGRLGGKGFIF